MQTRPKPNTSAKVPNLLQRKLGWYVRYQVPKKLHAIIGKREVVRSLETSDKREAMTRLHAAYAAIQKEVLDEGRRMTPVDVASAEAVAAALRSIAEAVRRKELPVPEVDEDLSLADLQSAELLDAHFATHRRRDDRTGIPLQLDSRVARAAEDVSLAISDPKYKPMSEWVQEHLASAEKDGLKRSTVLKRQRFLAEFRSWSGQLLDPRQVTVETAVEYTDHLRTQDASARVKKDALTNCHTFFEWLRNHRRLITSNPFHGLSAQIEGSRTRSGIRRRPWSREELLRILTGLNPASRLWVATALALYTGMRVDEISGMETKHVDDVSMRVVDAKNENSLRHVPIHPVIAPLVKSLVATSYDGYLISGITPTGYDKKHGVYISKRFSIQRPRLGLSDAETTFHSLRHNFTSAGEDAEIPETTMALFTGHKRQNITFGRYSSGREWNSLVSALCRISHKREVDDVVTKLVLDHPGNLGWRNRNVKELLATETVDP